MSLGTVPPVPVSGLLNKMTGRAFNEMWFRKAPLRKEGVIQGVGAFFHPLDGIMEWNRVYGPAGFLQWQFVVPFGAEDTLRLIVERISRHGAPAAPSPCSSASAPATPATCRSPRRAGRWRWTSRPGSRAWPSCSTGSTRRCWRPAAACTWPRTRGCGRSCWAKMYPRLEAFRKLRAEIDPGQVFMSDQALAAEPLGSR